METIPLNFLCGGILEMLCGEAELGSPTGPGRRRRAKVRHGVADDASGAAYPGPVGGTMVLAGVRGVASPGRESGPT